MMVSGRAQRDSARPALAVGGKQRLNRISIALLINYEFP